VNVLDRVQNLEDRVEEIGKSVDVNEERIAGKGGLQAALEALRVSVKADIKVLSDEVTALRRTLWTVGTGVVTASLLFSFSVLKLTGG